MTIDDLIKLMRNNRQGANRVQITDMIHEIERYSLGTEVDAANVAQNQLGIGNFKYELKGEKLILRK